jgi:subtilisin family serine protease
MAAPHAAGLAALLLSSNPELRGDVDRIEEIIEKSALGLTAPGESCGGVPGSSIPNNTYGWGRIDAWAALQANLRIFFFPLFYK